MVLFLKLEETKQNLFKKLLPIFQFSLRLSPYANNIQLDNIRSWLLAFKSKHNFLLFFLNWATGGFILIFLILTFSKFCPESDLTLSFRKKNSWIYKPSNTLYNSLPSYFVEFFWKTGLLILAFKCDIYGRVFSRPWFETSSAAIRYHVFQKNVMAKCTVWPKD